MSKELKFISIVLPAYNEEGNLIPLLDAIKESCVGFDHEILVVDDGSTDGTTAELKEAAKRNNRIRVLTLKRNFGQTAALAAGIDHAKGDCIVCLDADGQNDPRDIPKLVEKLREGFDVVSGWRKDRHDSLVSRKIPSWIANAIVSTVTGVHLHDYGCTLKAYRRPTIANLQLAGEMHRFLPAWCAWQGGKITELPVLHHPRVRGQSKYGAIRIFKVIIDLMTLKFFSGFLTKPNYLFSGWGMAFLALGIIAGGTAVYDKLGPDRFAHLRIPLLLLSTFLGIVAVFLVLMGLLAELLIRLYFQVREQKPYRLADE